MCPSEWMDQLVYDLIEHYEAEVLPSGLIYLELWMDNHGVLIIEETIKHRQMRVCYWLFDAKGHPVPEPEVIFHIDAGGQWIAYEIRRHTAGHHTFADLEMGQEELIVTDPKHQAALATFADSWAEVLRAQGWVGGAWKCITKPQACSENEAEPAQPPSVEDLLDWVDEYGLCTATDGCWVPPNAVCEHGCKSWLLELGLIK
jgi:hypothetical protein